ncbi:unnamed protein product [Heligmosomoides polygyrus]|uniref:Stanniocalcin n=1 Tax=Heligmosomoides polygyrus TaxID=6339 RepID=A0A183G2H6_HELPZ|nr:unnamed protein product [Heligmosomoides polygyrus]
METAFFAQREFAAGFCALRAQSQAREGTAFFAQREFAAGFCTLRAQSKAREGTPGCVPYKLLVWRLLSSLRGSSRLGSALFELRARLGKGLQGVCHTRCSYGDCFLRSEEFAARFCQAREETPGCVPYKQLVWRLLPSLRGSSRLGSALFERPGESASGFCVLRAAKRIRLKQCAKNSQRPVDVETSQISDTQLKWKNAAAPWNRTPDIPRMK